MHAAFETCKRLFNLEVSTVDMVHSLFTLSCRKETLSFVHPRVSRVSCPAGGERGGVHSGLDGVSWEIARVVRDALGSTQVDKVVVEKEVANAVVLIQIQVVS